MYLPLNEDKGNDSTTGEKVNSKQYSERFGDERSA